MPLLFAVREERWWGAEWLSAWLVLVCLDVVIEGCELSHGVEQTLQNGERQLLLRLSGTFCVASASRGLKKALCGCSSLHWPEMHISSLGPASGWAGTWLVSLLPLILPQHNSASWMSCFSN